MRIVPAGGSPIAKSPTNEGTSFPMSLHFCPLGPPGASAPWGARPVAVSTVSERKFRVARYDEAGFQSLHDPRSHAYLRI